MGINEARAREIAEHTAQEVIAKFTEESIHLIQDRITKLDDYMIAALVRAGKLEVFADPGFQRSYKHAQEGAAVSGRDSDYELLASLLVDRASRGQQRTVRAGIERSIEIVDQIDDEALRGLTIYYAITTFSPNAPELETGLDVMERVFNDLVDGPLPQGAEWLEHLDILNALRISNILRVPAFGHLYSELPNLYLAPGMAAEDLADPLVINGKTIRINGLIGDHELRPGFKRFLIWKKEDLLLNGIEESIANEIFDFAKRELGFGQVHQDLVEPFLERVRTRPTLTMVETWWSQLPQQVRVTGVGRALAHANSERLSAHHTLPAIK